MYYEERYLEKICECLDTMQLTSLLAVVCMAIIIMVLVVWCLRKDD